MVKEFLKAIAENDYSVPSNLSDFEAVKQVIGVLGSTDPEDRDELGYTILSKWIYRKELLTNNQLKELLQEAISDEKLFYKIGEKESDSVFLRSFTSLLIALILIRDNKERFLNEEEFTNVLERILTYCESEQDLRGYVEEKGWAHSAAHISDVLDECVLNRYTGLEECNRIFLAISNLLDHATDVFNAEEDERMVTAIVAMVERNKVPVDTLCSWIEEMKLSDKRDVTNMYKRINWKHFVRSLFFRLQKKGLSIGDENLLKVENKFNPWK